MVPRCGGPWRACSGLPAMRLSPRDVNDALMAAALVGGMGGATQGCRVVPTTTQCCIPHATCSSSSITTRAAEDEWRAADKVPCASSNLQVCAYGNSLPESWTRASMGPQAIMGPRPTARLHGCTSERPGCLEAERMWLCGGRCTLYALQQTGPVCDGKHRGGTRGSHQLVNMETAAAAVLPP
jgi:hypothetical protein